MPSSIENLITRSKGKMDKGRKLDTNNGTIMLREMKIKLDYGIMRDD